MTFITYSGLWYGWVIKIDMMLFVIAKLLGDMVMIIEQQEAKKNKRTKDPTTDKLDKIMTMLQVINRESDHLPKNNE